MRNARQDGFTLVELMIVITVSAVLLAMMIPTVRSYTMSSNLKSASHNIVDQLMLAHEKAISTGQMQTIRFMKDFQGSDYHIWDGTTAYPKWRLPKDVTYATGMQDTYRMTSGGQCLDTGIIIVTNPRGDRDTVSVRLSGLVLVY